MCYIETLSRLISCLMLMRLKSEILDFVNLSSMKIKSARQWLALPSTWPLKYLEMKATNPRRMFGLWEWLFTRCYLASVPTMQRVFPNSCRCLAPIVSISTLTYKRSLIILLMSLDPCYRLISTTELVSSKPRICFLPTILTLSNYSSCIIRKYPYLSHRLRFNRLSESLSISSIIKRRNSTS